MCSQLFTYLISICLILIANFCLCDGIKVIFSAKGSDAFVRLSESAYLYPEIYSTHDRTPEETTCANSYAGQTLVTQRGSPR